MRRGEKVLQMLDSRRGMALVLWSGVPAARAEEGWEGSDGGFQPWGNLENLGNLSRSKSAAGLW